MTDQVGRADRVAPRAGGAGRRGAHTVPGAPDRHAQPAEYFGTLDSTGTIAVGKRADLVLLPGNPLRDIRHTLEPAGVMLGGRWLDREALDRLLITPLKAETAGADLQWFFAHAWFNGGIYPTLSEARTDKRCNELPAAQQTTQTTWKAAPAQLDSLAQAAAGSQGDGERRRLRQRMAEQFGQLRAPSPRTTREL
jgi:hypothetical protein